MNFIHYVVCPKCRRQIRLDTFWSSPIFCCDVFYYSAGNTVGKINIVYADENSTRGMAE